MRLGELLEATIPPMGYELVDWELQPRSRLVRVFIDKPVGKPGDAGVTVEDCARVSNHLTHLFTVENVDYERLEVSSPGLDRPLKKLADFGRFAGEEAQVNLREMTDGARRLKGVLRGVEGENVLLETEKGTRTIPVAAIDKARLVPKIDWRKGK
ncbi:MAG: ribosome maturation factor RimP [Burkholderiales bacterium]